MQNLLNNLSRLLPGSAYKANPNDYVADGLVKTSISTKTNWPNKFLQAGWNWQFVGVEVEWDALERLHADAGLAPQLPTAAWRVSVPVYANGEQAGYATSGGWSPLLKKYIALAHLQSRWAAPGTAVKMEVTV